MFCPNEVSPLEECIRYYISFTLIIVQLEQLRDSHLEKLVKRWTLSKVRAVQKIILGCQNLVYDF
jgi:hypothetical protein